MNHKYFTSPIRASGDQGNCCGCRMCAMIVIKKLLALGDPTRFSEGGTEFLNGASGLNHV